MMRSMFSAISGLKNHQTFMDVVGNNIANVNTTGFKQSRVTFQDILSQTVRGPSGPQNGRGGVNPEQVGLGVLISGIDTVQTQGTLQSTGKLTDMAIQGDGYFVMNDGKQDFYSRDGAFDLGIDGTLVNPSSGLHVMGWQADPLTGLINTSVPPSTITVPVGAGMTGRASTTLAASGNLDAGTSMTAPNNTVPLQSTIYDSLGNPHTISVTFTHTAADTWTVGPLTSPDGTVTMTGGTPLKFNTAGKYDTTAGANTPGTMTLALTTPNGSGPISFSLDMSGMTQLASTPSSLSSNTDGASAGSLTTFTVGQAGDITGVYSNGYKQPLGQIALASFSNPSGLTKAGGNLFASSANSGTASVGVPDSAGRGQIATGFLEGSNVDLAQQFTNMIMAERGFQANSRVITTSDEILQDLVNIKH
jgi:flagellar hook protein FlgE